MGEAIANPALESAKPITPSSLYNDRWWKLGLAAAYSLPRPLSRSLARLALEAYRLAAKNRAEVVFENLLPVFGGGHAQARAAARRLFRQFGTKMADLLRYEAGASLGDCWHPLDRQKYLPQLTQKRGTLLVTPHLGNWEIGAAILAEHGVNFVAVTQAEPGVGFTETRQAARARLGVETVVVGQDAFAFLEVIRKLQSGATVAMLIDRPAPASAVEVELFGRKFLASIAPAELARASGCAVVATYIVHRAGKYEIGILPEFDLDRRELGSREGRRKVTARIVAMFEPVIREFADQWYHFVPIWPENA